MSQKIEALNERLDKLFPKERRQRSCVLSDGKVSPCWTLSASVAGLNFESKKGVIAWSTINMTTGKTGQAYYGVKSGEFAKSGILFNHCPFCGVEIHKSN